MRSGPRSGAFPGVATPLHITPDFWGKSSKGLGSIFFTAAGDAPPPGGAGLPYYCRLNPKRGGVWGFLVGDGENNSIESRNPPNPPFFFFKAPKAWPLACLAPPHLAIQLSRIESKLWASLIPLHVEERKNHTEEC